MACLADHLRDAGFRLTSSRLAVLEALENGGHHPSPAEVLEQGRRICPALGRATVYRTLELLMELGLLRPVYLGDGVLRVACVEGGHHHLVCLNCGDALHFDECLVGDLGLVLAERFDFQIKGHMLEFYGLCEKCRCDGPDTVSCLEERSARV
jgi:Fur family ferric uptake transcriptional regulator